MFFAVCIVIQLHNINQWNAQFYNLTHFPAHQIAHTDARKTYHIADTTVSLRMNPLGSKHKEDIRN
jgi:hypothetical protein